MSPRSGSCSVIVFSCLLRHRSGEERGEQVATVLPLDAVDEAGEEKDLPGGRGVSGGRLKRAVVTVFLQFGLQVADRRVQSPGVVVAGEVAADDVQRLLVPAVGAGAVSSHLRGSLPDRWRSAEDRLEDEPGNEEAEADECGTEQFRRDGRQGLLGSGGGEGDQVVVHGGSLPVV